MEGLDHVHDGAVAQIVGAGLEAQTENTHIAPAFALDDLHGGLLLDLVGGVDAVDDRHVHIQVVGQGAQGLGVLRQAGAAVGKAGFKVIGGDVELFVLAEDLHDLVAVDVELLADIADFVAEDDLEGVEGVVDILHDLRHADVGADKLGGDVLVDLAEDLLGPLAVGADESDGRVHVVLDGRALTQKFRVRDHGEALAARLAGGLGDDLADLLVGAGQNGAADGDDVEAVLLADSLTDLPSDAVDVFQIQMPVLAAGGADADEGDVGIFHSVDIIHGGLEHALVVGFLHELLNVRLNDGGLALVDEVHLAPGVVDADDMVPQLCQTRRAHTAHIAQTENTDIHNKNTPCHSSRRIGQRSAASGGQVFAIL